MSVTLYLIRNTSNGKVYVGQTSQTMEQRFKDHCADAKRGCKFVLHRAIRKYGVANFEVLLLTRADDEDQANRLEKAFIFIAQSNGKHGYNMTDGGRDKWVMTAEVRAKLKVLTPQEREVRRARGNIWGPINGRKAAAIGQTAAIGRIQGIKNVQSGQLDKIRTREGSLKGWKTGYAMGICSKGARASCHVRWHVKRGVVNLDCELCKKNKRPAFQSGPSGAELAEGIRLFKLAGRPQQGAVPPRLRPKWSADDMG